MTAMKLTDREEVDGIVREIDETSALLSKCSEVGSEIHICVLEIGERLDDARTITISRETGLKLLEGRRAMLKDRLVRLGVVDDRPVLMDAEKEPDAPEESLCVLPEPVVLHDPGCAFMKTRLMLEPRPCDCSRSEVVE